MSTRSAQQVLQRRLHCRFFNLQEQGFKHFVISQKLLGQSTWLSTRCAQQVGLRQLHCSSSVCKNNWANRLKGQRVLLSRLGCADYTFVSSFCRISVLNILLYLRNYWANRPECQRVVLSMLGCPDYTVVSAIFKNKCFKYFVISQKLLGQLTWGSTRSAQQVALRRLHCCFFNLQNTCFKHFVILRNYWANRPECQRVLLSRLGCADYTVVSSFCRISVLNILLHLRNYWANRPECQRVVLRRLGCADYTVVSSICKNKYFKHFVISQKLLGQLTWGSTRSAQQVGLRRRKFFSRRQSDSSLIVGRIIDPRPGLCALSMDPFVPRVTHWCTIYPSFHVVLRPRQKDERYASRCHSESTNLFFWFRKYSRTAIASSVKLYIIPIEEN